MNYNNYHNNLYNFLLENDNVLSDMDNDNETDSIENGSKDDKYYYGYDENFMVGTNSYSQVSSSNIQDNNNDMQLDNYYNNYVTKLSDNNEKPKLSYSQIASKSIYESNNQENIDELKNNKEEFDNKEELDNKENKKSKYEEDNKSINQYSSIYLLLSCDEDSFIHDIKIISENYPKDINVLNSKLIEVISDSSINELKNLDNILTVQNFNSLFKSKRIYLYRADLELESDEENFLITFIYDNEMIQSKSLLTIRKYQQLFIYNIFYDIIEKKSGKIKKLFKQAKNLIGMDRMTKSIKNLIEGKNKLTNLQKFVVYKRFLEEKKLGHLIPNLLEETQKNIIKPKRIDYEYLLIFTNAIINKEKYFYQIPGELRKILLNTLSSLFDKETIEIKSYNNDDYNYMIKLMESYANIHMYEKTDLTDGFYLFIILFYQFNYTTKGKRTYSVEDKFNNSFNNIIRKQNAIDFIINHKNLFPNLNSYNLRLIFERADKEKVSFNDVLMLASNFTEYLKFFCSYENYIEKNEPKIQFNKCPKPNENIDIDNLKKFIKILKTMNNLDDSDLYNIRKNIFDVIVECLKGRDYIKLEKLKDLISKDIDSIPLAESMLKKLDEALHITGKVFIENDKWDNMKILNYIQEDVKKHYNEHKRNKDFAALIGHIDLNKIDDEFCKKFIGNSNNPYDYRVQFESNYNIFISSIFKNADSYHHLKKLYRLFNIENNLAQDQHVIDNLVDTFSKNFDRKNIDDDELYILIFQLYRLVSYNRNYSINKLIKNTKRNFNESECKKIFINILNNFANELNNNMIEKLVKSINDFTYSDVFEILDQLKDDNIKSLVLRKIGSKAIKKEDIFNIEVSDNLEFLYNFIRKGYLSNETFQHENIQFIDKTVEIVSGTIEMLHSLKFDMNQLQKMYQLLKINDSDNDNSHKNIRNKNKLKLNLKERFYILSFGDSESHTMKKLYPEIVKVIKNCYDTLSKIDEIISIFKTYYPNEKKGIINDYEDLRNNILNNLIADFPKNMLNQLNFGNIYREAHQISQLKNSKIFITIYDYQKDNYKEDENAEEKEEEEESSDNVIFDKTKRMFLDFENLFKAETEDKIDLEFLDSIISKLDYNEIDKEINIMEKIFNIKEKPSNRINEKLKILNSINIMKNCFENIISLLDDFNLNSKKVRERLHEAIQNINDYGILNDLIEMDDSLKELNLNILNVNSKDSEYAISVINKMYEKPELIRFIKDKNVNDIHQMGEFIDDSEDFSISLADIDQLETCMTLIQELKEKGDGKSEKEFLNIFIKILKDNQNYSDIGIKFEDSAGKYSDFYELYTNHLNPNELNKVHIRKIYTNSQFQIINNYPECLCFVTYLNNSKKVRKNYDEMLELRTVALLRKKDQREPDYFEICEKFAEIISYIQEILKLISQISSKGYFEDLEYEIQVYFGSAFCKKVSFNETDEDYNIVEDGKNLRDIIDELNEILDDQNEKVRELYLNEPISRMIFGRQISSIYNYIADYSTPNKFIINQKNKHNKDVINILKYITNNSIENYKINPTDRFHEELSLDQMYKDVSNYLNQLYVENEITFQKINKKALLKNKERKGIYSHSCKLEDIESDTIYCSLDLTEEFPIAQTVLYCTTDTTEDEIISFIYRSTKCVQNALFIFIKPESLSREKKSLLIDLLKELYCEDPRKMKSCLLFIYSEGNKMDEVVIEIQKLPFHIYFDFDKSVRTKHFKRPSNIKVYSSEISGLGKSVLIKNNFKNEYPNHQYVYFPLGDNIHKKEIIDRLLKFTNRRIALHLDLCSINQVEIASEFLFSFLILNYYSQNENIFYYGNEMKIKVELPNDFIDYKTLFPILNFFENVHLTSTSMPQLIVQNDILSKIQIVSNYLKNIDRINKCDIYIPNLNERSPSSIQASVLSPQECSNIILQSLNITNPNYYQITSYINIMAEQLIHFSNSIYLNIEELNMNARVNRNLTDIRLFFVDSLKQNTKNFITSCYDNILKGQDITNDQQRNNNDIEKAKKKAISNLKEKQVFSFQSIRPSIIIINEDEYSLSIIKTCPNNSSECTLLKSIYQIDYSNRNKELIDYNKLKTRDFLIEVRKVLNLYNPIDKYDRNSPREKDNKRLGYLCDIVKSYVFTADNFMKLILISLRLRTDIPVVLMGETGCGKTSLIRIIAKLKDITMYTLNIHAGTEDVDIIQFLRDKNLFKHKNNKNHNNETVWVFLDEINTCNYLGLITEIMLKHSCKGEELRNNVKFIAACNPYRINTSKKEIVGLLDNENHKAGKLMYNVNPLPHSLLNFVFDFGSPDKKDTKKYISNMVFEFLRDIIREEDLLHKIQKIAEESIFDAHEYIKINFDISSVSLRDIRRFGILFKWFTNDLLKNPYMKRIFKLDNQEIYINSLNLSIYLCYFIRIFDKKKRTGFINKMKNSFGKQFNFEEFPKKIQWEIANAVKLEKGIARNKALLENLFAIFVCLNTKIPLFIIGKPGCSKSLSAQLIFKSMNGKDSSHEFFRYFPKVYTKSYQGSRTSTSKGILKIFEKARNSLKDKEFSKDIISAIYFDEMGLAEISKNNPLKVIHSQLEYDDNEKKVAFIGISNWPFDASKMNRGIHLSIPEPDQQDLIDTAIAIAKSYDTRLEQDYMKFYEDLSKTYFEFKNILKDKSDDFENRKLENSNEKYSKKNIKEFYGTRDFYHLIKIASKLFINNYFPTDKYEISRILNESIERNFGGLDNSIKIFKTILKKYFENIHSNSNYDVMKCISSNINDAKSRYLLVITKSSISQFLITLILDQLHKNYVFYYGSNFEEDTTKGYYSAKVLNKVQVTMNEDNVMILKNLAVMYPSLYDLFNQNFRKVGESNYARIALGNSNTQNYRVNNDFRCVVLVDKNELDQQDPPFINRFEKHIIKFEDLLDKRQREISKQIFNILYEFCKGNNKKLKIDLKSEIINCDLEEIQGIIYQFLVTNHYASDHKMDFENQSTIDENEVNSNKEAPEGNETLNNTINNDDEEIRKIFEVDSDSEVESEIFDNNNNDDEKESEISNENIDYTNKSKKSEFMNDNNIADKEEFVIKDMKIDYNSIKEKIYERIIPTFCQDLIFYFKNSEYGKSHSEEFNNILKIYLAEENLHKNFTSYIESISTGKHIIYTYSNILDVIFDTNTEIKNKTYGVFSKEKTKNVFINQYTSERDIDDAISEYYFKNNYNLCIIHFDIDECIHLNHINYLIENMENSLKERNTPYDLKPVVFIIHLKRVIINNQNNNKDDDEDEIVYNDYFISHLTEWKQLFIDNLNGMNISINEIINAKNIELFKNKNLIDLNEEFENELYHSFSFIEHKIKINVSNIKNEEYAVHICNLINSNKVLKETIQNLVMKKIESIKDNIIMDVFYNYEFEENDIDFISVLIKYIKSIYKNSLISSLVQMEQKNILSTILVMEKEFNHKFFKNIYRKIINQFDSKLEKYSVFSRTKIDLILGISFPFIITVFDNLHQYIKDNLINDYFCNENESTSSDKEDYINEKNRLVHNIQTELEKPYFSKIFLDEEFKHVFDQDKFLNILFKDYNLYYLSKLNNSISNKNILNLFYALFKIFMALDQSEDNNYYLTYGNIAKYILFLETYSEYINNIVEFINLMDTYIPDFMESFISKFSDNIFNGNKEFFTDNDIIFNLYESIVYCILNIEHDFNEFSDENFKLIINEIGIFCDKVINVNIKLGITLKQMLYLQDFIYVNEIFNHSGISLKDNLREYLNYLKNENELYLIPMYFRNNNDIKNIDDKNNPITKEFNFLYEKLSYEDYKKIIVKLLNNKIKISKNENYRLALLKILCSDNCIINKSKIIFETIFKKYHLCPKNVSDDHEEETNLFNENSNKNDYDKDTEEKNDDDDDDENEEEENDNEDNEDEEEDEDEEEEEEDYDDDDDDDDDDNEDGSKLIFLDELEKDKDNSIISFINESNNPFLDEVLLSLFDGKFDTYFNSKRNDKEKILNQSLLLFKNCVYYIENNDCKITIKNKLGVLYCISYIKYYCYHLSKILNINNKNKFEGLYGNEIFEFLNRRTEFRKIIKIYILRIFNNIIIKNYKKLIKYIDENELFNEEFDFSDKVPSSSNNLFLQNDTFELYKELRRVYMTCKLENFKTENDILEILNERTLLTFYDLIINEELSNVLKKPFNNNYYEKICNFISKIINILHLPRNSENILSLYYNYESLNNELSLIQNLSIEDYEILLYSHKFSFICSLSKPNTVYSNILSPNILENIRSIYIPGGEPEYNLLMESVIEIQDYIRGGGSGSVYKCSCDKWYIVDGCGGPMETKNCTLCGQIIGGTNHSLYRRPGHERICINSSQRNQFPNIPCIMLDDLVNQFEQMKRRHIIGFRKVFKRDFISRIKPVRNMNNITYRILSFIFYSCIYYATRLNYLSEKSSKNFYYADNNAQTIFSILKDIWTILCSELNKSGIENIQCFLNMVIPELSNIIIENEREMRRSDERENFEILCNGIIERSIRNYRNYYHEYMNANNEIREIKDDTMESILRETSNINKLSEVKYPLIKYFYTADYPSYEKFYNKFNELTDSTIHYPVISNYLNAVIEKSEKIKHLENFNLINPLVVYSINKYSNKISREEAKKITIAEEIENDRSMKKLFKKFKKGWENIYKDLSNYDCHGKLPVKNIKSSDSLAFILNDNFEDNYGKYISTAYKDFITYQNEFLSPFISNNINKEGKEYLDPYLYQINRKTIIQNASSNEIVSLTIENDIFDSFEEMIFAFSSRDISEEEGTINYVNYKNNNFDFDFIEKELTKILLADKKLFATEYEQIFMTYKYEGFTKNYNIISDFKDKIVKEESLEKENKNNIKNSIDRFNYEIILTNLQVLFVYFTNKRNINGNELLLDEIEQLPKNIIKINDDFLKIIQLNQLENIKINQLIDYYNYIEYLNYDKIIKNVSKEAYNELDETQIELLNKHFNKENIHISKKDLCNAVQKFISRYLISDRFNNYEWNIFEIINREGKPEFWDNALISSEENQNKFDEEIDLLKDINIKIGQSVHFSNYLGIENLKTSKKTRKTKTKNEKEKSKKSKKNNKKKLDY